MPFCLNLFHDQVMTGGASELPLRPGNWRLLVDKNDRRLTSAVNGIAKPKSSLAAHFRNHSEIGWRGTRRETMVVGT